MESKVAQQSSPNAPAPSSASQTTTVPSTPGHHNPQPIIDVGRDHSLKVATTGLVAKLLAITRTTGNCCMVHDDQTVGHLAIERGSGELRIGWYEERVTDDGSAVTPLLHESAFRPAIAMGQASATQSTVIDDQTVTDMVMAMGHAFDHPLANALLMALRRVLPATFHPVPIVHTVVEYAVETAACLLPFTVVPVFIVESCERGDRRKTRIWQPEPLQTGALLFDHGKRTVELMASNDGPLSNGLLLPAAPHGYAFVPQPTDRPSLADDVEGKGHFSVGLERAAGLWSTHDVRAFSDAYVALSVHLRLAHALIDHGTLHKWLMAEHGTTPLALQDYLAGYVSKNATPQTDVATLPLSSALSLIANGPVATDGRRAKARSQTTTYIFIDRKTTGRHSFKPFQLKSDSTHDPFISLTVTGHKPEKNEAGWQFVIHIEHERVGKGQSSGKLALGEVVGSVTRLIVNSRI